MRTRRVPLGVIAAVLLIGLVGLLGTLQYRWLGQVSQAEREQLRRSLDQRARDFADNFDAEISRVYLALQLRAEALEKGDWSAFAAGVEQWRSSARFTALLRAVYLVDASAGRQFLRAYDPSTRTFGPPADAWPEHLAPIRGHLTAAPSLPSSDATGGPRWIALPLVPIAPDVPALLVPVTRHVTSAGAGAGVLAARWSGSYVLADLDGEYLRRTMIPALVAQHFPEQGAGSYRVAILSGAGAPVFSRGFPAGAPVDPARADLVASFFSLRLEVNRELLPGAGQDVLLRSAARPPGGSNMAYSQIGERVAVFVEHREPTVKGHASSAIGQIRVVRPGWRLVLAHASGSLDVAVAQARRRNMWLVSGILGVLAAGVAMVLANARRAGRLAAQQMDFVATVSHELRTPLAVIRSAAQNLSAGVVSEPERARRYGELIEDEGRQLTEMVEQVLEYARITGGREVPCEAVDLAEVAREVGRSCQPLCDEAGVTLEVSASAQDGVTVAGDQAGLRRVLHNLLVNALKHGAGGRWIGLRVEPVAGRRRSEVRAAVSDRGRGIEADELGHVFEPFFRGRRAIDEQVHGNGLGLSLVRRVVDAHGGRVAVESTPGHGTTFTIHLPSMSGAAGARSAGADPRSGRADPGSEAQA